MLSQIKLLLRTMGIRDLAIRFDTDRRVIVATFTQGGAEQVSEIPFSQIEQTFSTEGAATLPKSAD